MRSLAWVSALLGGAAVLRADAAAATVCPTTGEPAPDVITLMASTAAPATDAWIIQPDCSVETVSVQYDTFFQLENKQIEHVISIPSGAIDIAFIKSPLSRGADFSAATKAESVLINSFDPALLDKLKLPSAITSLFLIDTPYPALDDFVFPATLQILRISGNLVQSFKNVTLPKGLKQLYIGDIMTAIDFVIPPKLTSFFATGLFPSIERIKLPDSITTLGLSNTSVVRGVTWPANLKTLYLKGNAFTNFEIRQSDVELFSNAFTGYTPIEFTATCSDPSGIVTTIKSMTMCVISDARFETLYGDALTPSSSFDGSERDAGSGTSSNDPSGNSTATDSSETTNSQIGSTEVGEGGQPTNLNGGKATREPSSTESSSTKTTPAPNTLAEVLKGTNASSPPGTTSKSSRKPYSTASPLKSSGDQSTSSGMTDQTTELVHVTTSMSSTILIAVIVVGVALAMLIAGLVSRSMAAATRRRGKGDDGNRTYETLDTPSSMSNVFRTMEASTASSQTPIPNDIRYDPLLLPFRLKSKDISVGKQIASGSVGVIYRGKHQGNDVVIKRIHPGLSSDKRVVSGFMDEIRVCASVDHPKIVAFVGMAWSNERDLSVITELMDGGDLQTALYAESDASCAGDWSSAWSSKQLKNKSAMALDVAEALAYLHSFGQPILSRDLRARNVLLDSAGNAKLSASGIGHDASIDETMRSTVNMTAWTAPEVLFGEPATMQSDVYALGVLLVELDRCCHPFAHVQALFSASASELNIKATDLDENASNEIAHKNIQIAVLVSLGRLCPSVTSECPARVAALVTKCVSFDPAQRPTVRQVQDELRYIVEQLK